MSLKSVQILVIDLGSQYSLVISRTLRELGVRSAVLAPAQAAQWLKTNTPKGIILSGGRYGVYENGAPTPPAEILTLGVPILGICYGMQWLAHVLGGRITKDRRHKEYGGAGISVDTNDTLFAMIAPEQSVWASHGDSVDAVPEGFTVIARSKGEDTIAAMVDERRQIWGLQFHPEVVQTTYGKDMLRQFLFAICNCDDDWRPEDIIGTIQEEARAAIGEDKAVIGFSGGVDSTTLTRMLVPILGERLLAVTIDTGGLREGELHEITANAQAAGAQHRIIDRTPQFSRALSHVVDAERKRAAFRYVYRATLNRVAREFRDAKRAGRRSGTIYVVQGSLATDFIESGRKGESSTIKTHHNVGLKLAFPQLHPLHDLFKYEVRELGRNLGLPPSVTEREPFPGPGLYIRVVGATPTPERVAIVRWADTVVRRLIAETEPSETFSQLVVALDCNRFVGVKGDGRTYAHAILVRAVETADFMTAVGHQFIRDLRVNITRELTKHPSIVHVFYAETNKPPATTEFE